MNLVLYAVPFFILALAIELAWGYSRGANTYRLADTINSLQMGTLSRLRGVLQIGIGGAVYGALTNEFTAFEMDTADPLVWVLAFIAYDFCYYWSHRMGHEWRLFWASHVAHHQSEEYNLSTALRQTSTGYLSFIFYIPLYVLGFPPYVLITVGSLNLIYQFWVHTEHIRTLGPLEWIFITPSNHRVHHAKNPEYLDKNYGGVFILWDRLLGTFKAEEPHRPCVYGTTEQLASWNPLWANLHVYVGGVKDMVRTRYPSDALKLWFKGPAWRPRDLRDGPPHDWQAPKFNPPASAFARAYAFAQFWVAVPLSFAVLFSEMSREMVLTSAALLAYGFYVQGTWLEGRAYARVLEWLRLAATLSLAWYGAQIAFSWNTGIAVWLSGYAAVSATGLLWAALTHRDSLAEAPGERPALSKPPEAAAS
ncbi:MAG: sterol desaturase family protein [Gammaproteobacteria bacterium]|nr:MAG: sterol desaturase family protein [Gammaproteobacteria bacterium]